MRITTIALLCVLSIQASADQRIRLPNGSECWVNNNNYVYGCSGGSGGAPGNAAQANKTPATCIEVEAELKSINRQLRQGYNSRQGTILKSKRSEYEEILDKYCK
jgi:hypothetical protein